MFVAAQHGFDPIQYIGAHHAEFIDHQQVKTPDDIDFFLAEAPLRQVAVRHIGTERQLKK